METLVADKIEQEIISIIKDACIHQEINEEVDEEFVPGKFFMSQILVSMFPQIEIVTGITIPMDCYIFHDSKTKKQLNIKDATSKLLNLLKNGQ